MISNRPLEENDLPTLQKALDNNEFHPGQTVSDYVGVGKHTIVYEDEQGPVGYLRYTKTLRLVVTWTDNKDEKRNAESIIAAVNDSVKLAKGNGFTEIIFESESPKVIAFCKLLGFQRSGKIVHRA